MHTYIHTHDTFLKFASRKLFETQKKEKQINLREK